MNVIWLGFIMVLYLAVLEFLPFRYLKFQLGVHVGIIPFFLTQIINSFIMYGTMHIVHRYFDVRFFEPFLGLIIGGVCSHLTIEFFCRQFVYPYIDLMGANNENVPDEHEYEPVADVG